MSNNSFRIGVVPTVTIVFIILKLVGTISWSWFWVFSPLWILLLLIGALVLIGDLIDSNDY